MTATNFCWEVIGIKHLFTPILIIVFKGHHDLFKSFSKLQGLAKVSMFQIANVIDGRSSFTSVQTAKKKCCFGLFFINSTMKNSTLQ
jgi:hypothetical protein